MFRLTQFMQEVIAPTPLGRRREPPGPVVIWNLGRRCNLACKHCYSLSADADFPGELSTDEVFEVMDQLKAFRVPALILSGGEPLLRPDIFQISRRAKEMGFFVGLSTNGTLIDGVTAGTIAAIGYDYVGISLDGVGATHDRFRRRTGAFDASLAAVRRCRDLGLKVGLRFTMTADNAVELPAMLDLVERERIERFYFSHLNYAGRGNHNRKDDAFRSTTRRAITILFQRCLALIREGRPKEIVTGNNDADGPFFLLWVKEHFPARAGHIEARLRRWGGNASGVHIANIDNTGEVHPDTMWPHLSLGNVRRRSFGEIWTDTSNPVMAALKRRPRAVQGRCGACRYLDICGGNTRVRAHQVTGDMWAEDPGCYLGNDEIGVDVLAARVAVTPFSASRGLGRSG